MKAIDISNKRFGRAVAIRSLEATPQGIKWEFLCDCGNKFTRLAKVVKYQGEKSSCGCLQKEIYSERCKTLNKTHGMTNSREFNSWSSMKDRCTNPNAPKYNHYGGRGISFCEEWKLFENFYRDMGSRPDGTTLDRIDVNKGYSKENCRWATHLEQRHNRRPHIGKR